MNFREHVIADVATWPASSRFDWEAMVASNHAGAWARYPAAEVELRAWLHLRSGDQAREPVVLNRHHLTPVAPQPTGRGWPEQALYCGRAPMAAPPLRAPGGEAWRFSHLLGNRFQARDYPDALERYRHDLRRWLYQEFQATANHSDVAHPPEIDAIRELTPLCALVCSCVSSPWTPVFIVRPEEPLPPTVTCHCHLIIAAWRALQRKAGP